MNRRRPPSHFYQPGYSQNSGNIFPVAPPAVPQCVVPQNYYYLRLPGYAPYSQYAYPNLPYSGMDCYRMITPLNNIPSAVGFPYQLPAGYQVVRASAVAQPFYNACNPARPPTLSCFDQLVASSEQPERSNRTDAGVSLHDTRDRTQLSLSSRNCKKSNKSKKQHDVSKLNNVASTSFRARAHYGTNYRRKADRKQALKSKQARASRSSFSANEVSSIAWLSDDDYHTCDEIGSSEESNWIKDSIFQASGTGCRAENSLADHSCKCIQSVTDAARAVDNSLLEYTLITNDKSYSYVNYDPEKLPTKLERIIIEPQVSSILNKAQQKVGRNSAAFSLSSIDNHTSQESVNRSISSKNSFCNEYNATTFQGVEKRCHSTTKLEEANENSEIQGKLVCSGETRITINKPSVFGEAEKCNQTLDLDPVRDLWWDSSTDISCKSSAPPSKPSGSKESSSQLLSSQSSKTTNISHPDTTVLSNNGATLQDDRTKQNPNISDSLELAQDISNVANKNYHSSLLTKKKVVPQKYLTLSFVDVQKTKCFNGEINAADLHENPTLLPEKKRVELADEDNAIVAVISHDRFDLNNEQEQSLQNPNQSSAEQSARNILDQNVVTDVELDFHLTNSRPSVMSITRQQSWSLTSGVKSLPCSPLLSDLSSPESLLRSRSCSLFNERSETDPQIDKTSRICTPHSRVYTNSSLGNTNQNGTFSLCLNNVTNQRVLTRGHSKAKLEFTTDDKKCSSLLSTDNDVSNRRSVRSDTFFAQESTKEDGGKNFSWTEPRQSTFEKSDDMIAEFPSSGNVAYLKKCFLSNGVGSNTIIQKVGYPLSHEPLNTSFKAGFGENKNSPKKTSFAATKVASFDCNKNTVVASQTNLTHLTQQHIQSLPDSSGNSVLLHYIEKASKLSSTDTSSTIVSRNPRSRIIVKAEKLKKQDRVDSSCDLKSPDADEKRSAESSTFNNSVSAKDFIQLSVTSASAYNLSKVTTFHNRNRSVELVPQSTISKASFTSSKAYETNDNNMSSGLARSRVTSTIKSRVQQLVDCSLRTSANPIYSPCLAALQAAGFNRKRFGVFPVFSSYASKVSRSRSNSLPSSPKRSSVVNCLQKSASLSDVFYDSTENDSSLFNSKTLATTFSSDKSSNLLSNNTSVSKDQKFLAQLNEKDTYVSYPLPTPTPDYPSCLQNKVASNFALENRQYADISRSSYPTNAENNHPEVKSDGSVSTGSGMTSSGSFAENRFQKLDEDTENALRKSAQVLIDSVKDVQHSSNLSYEDHVHDDRPRAKFDVDTVASPFQQSNQEEVRGFDHELLNRSTQTPERFSSVDEKDANKKPLPPKEPPRSKSPNVQQKTSCKSDSHDKNAGSSRRAVVCSNPSTAPTFFPYFPLFAVAGSTSEARYISSSLAPTNLGQHILRGPCIPPISWYPLSCLNNSPLKPKCKTMNKNTSNLRLSNESLDANQSSTETGTSFTKLKVSERPRSSSITTIGSGAKDDRPEGAAAAPCIFVPCQANPESVIVDPYHPYFKRRLFSEINLGTKSRTGRRNMNLFLAKRPYMAKPSVKSTKQRQANVSHPAAKRVTRRPRFVRSSLSDDTVYEMVKERKGSFVTRPALKMLQQNTARNVTSNICNDKSAKSDAETGYSSAVSPDKENICKRMKVDEVCRKKREEIENKENNACINEGNVDLDEKTLNKEHKKSTKLFTIQRTLRKIIPGKKHPKQSRLFENSESSNVKRPLKKSKTDTKLLAKDSEVHCRSKTGTPREFFGKSKKVLFHTDDESTLKAEAKLNVPVSLVKVSRFGKKSEHSPDTYTQSAVLKDVLLNRNALFSYEVNEVSANTSNPGGLVRELTDCSAGTIDRNSDKGSVSTPGIRINSETGDVMCDETCHDKSAKEELQKRRHKKLLSSTAIDEL